MLQTPRTTMRMGLCLAVVLVLLAGCSMEAQPGEVRVEIQETLDDDDKESYQDRMEAIRGSKGVTKILTMNGKVVFVFGGVDDVQAFADKITFAEVVEVKEAERTVIISVE